jgi:hypothetical protein
LGISAAVLTALVATEQIGKIGGVGDMKRLYYLHQGKDEQGMKLEDFDMAEEHEYVELTEAEKGKLFPFGDIGPNLITGL